MRHTRRTWIIVAAVASCGEPMAPELNSANKLPDVRPFVIGEAAAAVDSRGRFVFPDPVSPGQLPIISPEQSAVLAEAYLAMIKRSSNVFCPPGQTCMSSREAVQSARCRPIDWSSVKVQTDLWVYGEPATLPIPDSIPRSMQNHIGPRYHFPLFDRGMWIATINVAAYATEVSVGSDGELLGRAGSEFRFSSVPCSADAGVPAAAEQAVKFAALRTGRKVTMRPLLLNPGGDVGPGGARWKLHLDGDISVRSPLDGSEHIVDVVYVGMWSSIEEQATPGTRLRLFVPAAQQPDTDVPAQWRDAQSEVHTLIRQRAADRPLLFMEVEVLAN